MIVCPNCNHQNPDGAVQCEACYTPLPATMACPNCGATVQADASFCGQCGFDLRSVASTPAAATPAESGIPPAAVDIPELVPPEPLVAPEPVAFDPKVTVPSHPIPSHPDLEESTPAAKPVVAATPPAPASTSASGTAGLRTQLQQQTVRLLHVQTNTIVELPQGLSVIHIGKPNDRIPPDLDVSGFPNSEIVSRIHADIRIEGDAYYIEDVGSSNGTYINNLPLSIGNRHRLRPGDRIALGKGDKVSFLFQLS